MKNFLENIVENLEKYFNTGSTDKQNKRRLGGLLIAITAILLVLSILTTAGCGTVALIDGIIDSAMGDDGASLGTNGDLVPVSPEEVTNKATANTIVLDNSVPENLSVSIFGGSAVRPDKANGADIYQAKNKQGLQKVAYDALNQMIIDFHSQSSKDITLWLDRAYSTESSNQNIGYFTNALAVDIWYKHGDTSEDYSPIHKNMTDFSWIFNHAHEYGFVLVSKNEGDSTLAKGSEYTNDYYAYWGEKSIFRYVGPAHAKYIHDKQEKSKADNFYTIEKYVEDLRASTTPDKEKSVKVNSVTYSVYYMAPIDTTAPAPGGTAESTAPEAVVSYRLPNSEIFECDVTALANGGYIVTYWKAPKSK